MSNTGTTVSERSRLGHTRWVRTSHWIIAASVLTLAFSGVVILMAHPRLYWGRVGNDLMPALLELPLGRNYHAVTFGASVEFFPGTRPILTAPRTYDIFNQNGWARSLHFLGAWCLTLTAFLYMVAGAFGGHLWSDLVPRPGDLSPVALWRDIRAHLRLPLPPAAGGPPYGLLQRLAYFLVICVALPLMLLTGITMSPAITAAMPSLLDLFGGSQSARTVHFFTFTFLILFVIVHLTMVVLSGFKRQMRAMTVGG